MPGRRYNGDGAGVINGKLYVAGGWNYPDSVLPQSQLFVYDPATNQWSTGAPMPQQVLYGSAGGATGVIGGKLYEPVEDNPMLGWRGASRYYDPKYIEGFKLECLAFKKAREEMGLTNIKIMVPFCRTIEEGKKVLKIMAEHGLKRGVKGLEVYVMCEIPSNVILGKEFSAIFDGFSIGSNDLTQLTLGVDRDSELVSHVYNEKNESVKSLIRQIIGTAHKYKRKVGICGQAPSDFPDFAQFLVRAGIDSISLIPDTVISTTVKIAQAEKK